LEKEKESGVDGRGTLWRIGRLNLPELQRNEQALFF